MKNEENTDVEVLDIPEYIDQPEYVKIKRQIILCRRLVGFV